MAKEAKGERGGAWRRCPGLVFFFEPFSSDGALKKVACGACGAQPRRYIATISPGPERAASVGSITTTSSGSPEVELDAGAPGA